MSAGGSQLAQSYGASLDAVALEKQAYHRSAQARRNRAGCLGEREVCRELSRLAMSGVHHLDDRRWGADSSRKTNLDHLVIAPGGVFVVDAKNWEGRIEVRGHSVLQDGVVRDDRLVALAWLRHRVEEVLAASSAASVRPVPLVCFAKRTPGLPLSVGATFLADIDSLGDVITRRPAVLTPDQLHELAELFEYSFPPYEVDAQAAAEAEGFLFPEEVTRNAGLAAALAAPVEDWMVWLHPTQAGIVHRTFTGPARIRGAAGTGKTSVGLHRIAWLASTRPGRFLVTSFVKTLPPMLGAAYARLSPSTVDRVDFLHAHIVATALLKEAGIKSQADSGKAAFTAAWRREGESLGSTGLTKEYFREELQHVIKGRALSSLDEYLAVERVGRRTPLQPETRRVVWRLYERYEAELAERGVQDFTDVLRKARDVALSLQQSPWRGVLVDEAQDLPLVGLQMLHALAGGDRSDGLLLVGDGQQAIYPGGFKLGEAGISVAGRGVVLKVNYRNTVEVLAAAKAVVMNDSYDDLDLLGQDGDRDTEVVRHGDVPVVAVFDSLAEHDAALLWDIEGLLARGVPASSIAVLCQTNALAEEYAAVLAGAQVPTALLKDGPGDADDAVIVGTWFRSKGMEFPHVFMPQADRRSKLITGGGEAAEAEKAELFRRQQYVAMTRARDTLWVGRLSQSG